MHNHDRLHKSARLAFLAGGSPKIVVQRDKGQLAAGSREKSCFSGSALVTKSPRIAGQSG
jgi:hypothetical protein